MAETILCQVLAVADQKVSRAAFRGSLFVDRDGAPRSGGSFPHTSWLANRTSDSSLLEAKQLPLFSPVDRYLWCQSH
jgi:hypothetical protein